MRDNSTGLSERTITASGVIGWSVLEDLIPRIDAVVEEGYCAVVNMGKVTGITSFACRQLLKRVNNDERVKLEDVSSGVKSALDLHGAILKEEASR